VGSDFGGALSFFYQRARGWFLDVALTRIYLGARARKAIRRLSHL